MVSNPETTLRPDTITAQEAQKRVEDARAYLNAVLAEAPGSFKVTGGRLEAISSDEDVLDLDDITWLSSDARNQYNRRHQIPPEERTVGGVAGGEASAWGGPIADAETETVEFAPPQDLAVIANNALSQLKEAINLRDSLGTAGALSSGGGSAVDAYIASSPTVSRTLKQQYEDFVDRATDITRLREEEQQFDIRAADATRKAIEGFRSGLTSSSFTPISFGLPPSSGEQFQRFSAGAAGFPLPQSGGINFSAPPSGGMSFANPGALPGLAEVGLLPGFQRGTERYQEGTEVIDPELAPLMGKGSINMAVGPPVPPGIPYRGHR